MIGIVEHISHERDFKVLCDGLLRFEVGTLVQTYGALGSDKGIDAEFNGEFAGIRGRWVFQYKFLSPHEAPARRRRRLKEIYCPKDPKAGEFLREGVADAMSTSYSPTCR